MGKKSKTRVLKEREPLEPVPDTLADGDSKFARALGSGDYHTRDKGVKALASWLQSQEKVDSDSLHKLWKGILYCFWHSDKAAVQRDLALRLAGLLSTVQDEVRYHSAKADQIACMLQSQFHNISSTQDMRNCLINAASAPMLKLERCAKIRR
jgi:hypothetical protein